MSDFDKDYAKAIAEAPEEVREIIRELTRERDEAKQALIDNGAEHLRVCKMLDEARREVEELKAGMKSWAVAREIEMYANSEHQWNEMKAERDQLKRRLAKYESVGINPGKRT